MSEDLKKFAKEIDALAARRNLSDRSDKPLAAVG